MHSLVPSAWMIDSSACLPRVCMCSPPDHIVTVAPEVSTLLVMKPQYCDGSKVQLYI